MAPHPRIAQYLHFTSPTPGPSPARTFSTGAWPDRPRRAQAHSSWTAAGRGQARGFLIGRAPR